MTLTHPSLRVRQPGLPSRCLWVLGAVCVGAAVRGIDVNTPPGDDGEQPDTFCDALCDPRWRAPIKGRYGSCRGCVLCFCAAVDGGGQSVVCC